MPSFPFGFLWGEPRGLETRTARLREEPVCKVRKGTGSGAGSGRTRPGCSWCVSRGRAEWAQRGPGGTVGRRPFATCGISEHRFRRELYGLVLLWVPCFKCRERERVWVSIFLCQSFHNFRLSVVKTPAVVHPGRRPCRGSQVRLTVQLLHVLPECCTNELVALETWKWTGCF